MYKKQNNFIHTRNFLIKRGLWLILLEFTIINFGIYFDIGFHTLTFLVVAAIGLGFIILALMLKLSPKTIGIVGLVIIFTHNLFPLIPFANGSILKLILSPLFGPAAFALTTKMSFIIGYPPLPWLGIMLVGFAAGKLFELTSASRKKLFLKIGLSSLLLFVILRFINIYGDPSNWAPQKDGTYTILSFLNVSKYPPSLLFCAITLGLMFVILAFAEQTKSAFAKIFSTYGKVPLFYFIVHFFLIHTIMVGVIFLQGFNWSELDFVSATFGRPKGVTSGVNLWVIYLIWTSVVLILYKPCRWYGKYKSEHHQWWLKYI